MMQTIWQFYSPEYRSHFQLLALVFAVNVFLKKNHDLNIDFLLDKTHKKMVRLLNEKKAF